MATFAPHIAGLRKDRRDNPHRIADGLLSPPREKEKVRFFTLGLPNESAKSVGSAAEASSKYFALEPVRRPAARSFSEEGEILAHRLRPKRGRLFQSLKLVSMLGLPPINRTLCWPIKPIITIIIAVSRQRLETEASMSRTLSVLNFTLDGVFMFDASTLRFFYVNEGAVQQLGYTREELLGMTLLDLEAEFDEPHYRAMISPLLDGRCDSQTLSTLYRHKDGMDVPVEIVLQCSPSSAGQQALVAIVRDITVRRQAEEVRRLYQERLEEQVQERTVELAIANERLRERQAELKEAQRVANLGGWKWVAQTDSFSCSEELCRIFGRDPEGPTPSYKDGPRVFTPESWASLQPAVQRTLRTGMPYELDLEIVRPDGTHRWITVRGEAMTNAAEEIVGLRGTAQDITERKEAEGEIRRLVAKLEQQNAELIARNQELLGSEQKLLLQGTALETAANAVVITDTEGIILWVNSAFVALTGYTSEEAIGKTPRLLKSGQHDLEFYKTLWTTLLAGRTWRGNFTNRRKDGSFYHDEHTITPVRTKDGRDHAFHCDPE